MDSTEHDALDRLFSDVEPTLRKKDAAALIGVSPQTLQRLIDSEKIPAYRPAGQWILLSEDVKEYMRTTQNRS